MAQATRVTAFEAETRLALLLDLVERGQTVTIMRRGEPVACLAPVHAESETKLELLSLPRRS